MIVKSQVLKLSEPFITEKGVIMRNPLWPMKNTAKRRDRQYSSLTED